MYEVCDSREACSTVSGPIITTTMPLDKDINLDDTISNIKASMSRMEFDQSFSFALMAGMTLKVHDRAITISIYADSILCISSTEPRSLYRF